MSMRKEAVFSVDTVARYLYSINNGISPLKLQKSLYFLFAYHGAVYGRDVKEGEFEGVTGSPKYLFDAKFEAWQYGPVIREVYARDKQNEYANPEKIQQAIAEISQEPEIKLFIDDLFTQINEVSDFKLVDRSHQDEVWIRAYNEGQSSIMDNDKIIEEYIEKYV